MSILKSMDDKGSACARYLFSYSRKAVSGISSTHIKTTAIRFLFAGEPEGYLSPMTLTNLQMISGAA
jgi:hypothetical protein